MKGKLQQESLVFGLKITRALLTHPGFSSKLARSILKSGGVERAIDALLREFELHPEARSHRTAREIMGFNMLGIPEVERALGKLSKETEGRLNSIPFSEETLCACAQTHLLVADTGISIFEAFKRCRRKGVYDRDQSPLTESIIHPWFRKEPFANDKKDPCWRLIRIVPQVLYDEDFDDLSGAVSRLINPETEEVPSMRDLFFLKAITSLNNDHFYRGETEALNTSHFAWYSSDGPHIMMEAYRFNEPWIQKEEHVEKPDSYPNRNRCLPSARKPDLPI